VNNNRELVLEAGEVIKRLAAEVQTVALASAAEQRAADAYQSSVILIAEATDRFQAAANTVDKNMREMSKDVESVKTQNQKQAVDALDEAKSVRQLIETEHTDWKIAETRLKKGIKWAVGISVCVFVLSISTLVYVFWHLRA
jgi:hypothetical protein